MIITTTQKKKEKEREELRKKKGDDRLRALCCNQPIDPSRDPGLKFHVSIPTYKALCFSYNVQLESNSYLIAWRLPVSRRVVAL